MLLYGDNVAALLGVLQNALGIQWLDGVHIDHGDLDAFRRQHLSGFQRFVDH